MQTTSPHFLFLTTSTREPGLAGQPLGVADVAGLAGGGDEEEDVAG